MKSNESKCFSESVVKIDSIYYHSVPPSSKLYDSIWVESHGLSDQKSFTEPRDPKSAAISLQKLSLMLFADWVSKNKKLVEFTVPISVLDVCAGHGGYSLSAIDMGAGSVYMCDGSRGTLNHMSKQLSLNDHYKKYSEKLVPIQADVENIRNVFKPQSFELVFQRYAIHHMRSPMKTVHDLACLTKPGGILSFNYFISGCTPAISRELRSHFLTKDVHYVRNFFTRVGRLKSDPDNMTLKDVIQGDIEIDGYDDTIKYLRELVDKYGFDLLDKHVHYEDANTPYIHNIDPEKMENFIVKELGLRLVDGYRTFDEEAITMMIPPSGVRKNPTIPDSIEYSSEDIHLGDQLIEILKKL
jgi:ubiquinone/menaquinone biosynthesis C-methylase UbiE